MKCKDCFHCNVCEARANLGDITSNAETCVNFIDRSYVIVPPCKVGDTVYCFCDCFGVVLPYFVTNMTIGFVGKDRDYIAFEANCHAEETDELLDGIDFEVDDIGKTVFLTREEAEKALEKEKNDE